jgi:predicted PurR-regulated permease PerM
MILLDAPLVMSKLKKYSYWLMLLLLVWLGLSRLGTPFVTVLFAYFVLQKLSFLQRKWLTILIFLVLVAVVCLGLTYFIDKAIRTLPRVAEKGIPAMIHYAKANKLELPFSNWDELKVFALENIQSKVPYLSNFAKVATKHFVLLVIGIVIAVSIYVNPATDLNAKGYTIRNNLYTCFFHEVTARFRTLYHAFATVMGAQLLISSINTVLTLGFVLWAQLPYPTLIFVITFLCGLLPIVGNLISNSIIVGIAASTDQPHMALWALVFLIILHKLEYFLNSKIIGDRIKNPVWLTLIALIVGERLMGIPGMILAPVVLYYLKVEASQTEVCE